jgi:hypothetical protein
MSAVETLQGTIDAATSHPKFTVAMIRNDMRVAVLAVGEANVAIERGDFAEAARKLAEARAFLKLAGEHVEGAVFVVGREMR